MKRMVLVLVAGCAASPGSGAPALEPLPVTRPPTVTSGTWTPLVNQPTFAAGVSLLLTDGTLLVQNAGTANWWKLTPDATGSYLRGTWSQAGTMPGGYAPLYFASAVLPDGRVIVEGGEYLNNSATWTTKGAIYDPKLDQWTAVMPPTGWTSIGDASGIVLPDGTFLLSDCCTKNMATLDLSNMSWHTTGAGKEDIHDEESWVLLPNGKVLTADANNTAALTESEIFDPATGMWTSAGSTVVQLADLTAQGGGSHEVGPALLRGDGTVIATGATGHNALYDTKTGMWSKAPDFPMSSGMQLDIADGTGAVLPNDNVIVATSPGVFNPGITFFEWDGTAFTQVAATANAAADSSYNLNMLVLPTGEVLLTDQGADAELYTPATGPKLDYQPVVMSMPKEVTASDPNPLAPQPGELAPTGVALEPLATLHGGVTYKFWLQRPNGISQGAYYGDDEQASTNYPIVRLANQATGHVAYARTHDGSTYGIGMDVVGSTRFDVPVTAEHGLTTLTVIANGIPSPALTVDIK